jgi:16S rRNA (uracil1498-N3)-methyltransferase
MNVFIAKIEGRSATLDLEESHHCSKVLRNKIGDTVQLIDGKGNYYKGVLDLVSDKHCRAAITDGPRVQSKRPYQLHLVIAPTKNIDRMEWLIEKSVEIGIDEITFIKCQNSERTIVKMERIQKIVETAVKQSLQAIIPKVNGMIGFKEFCKLNSPGYKFIAHCFDAEKMNIKAIEFNNKQNLKKFL